MFSNTTYAIISLILMYLAVNFVQGNIMSFMFDLYYIIFTDYDKYILSRVNYVIMVIVILVGIYKKYVLKWEKIYINNNNIIEYTKQLDALLEKVK